MGDFEVNQRWKIYLDKETREKLREIKDHLKQNYDGPSDFVQKKIQEEEPISLDEKIRRQENEIERARDNLEKLKQIKREREEQDRLRDKKQLLKEKQKKLTKVAGRQGKDRSALREEVEEEHLKDKPPRFSDEEYLEKKSDRIDRVVEKRIEEAPSLDELVEDVERLQEQVKELNGGRLDWFLDLKNDVEVEA